MPILSWTESFFCHFPKALRKGRFFIQRCEKTNVGPALSCVLRSIAPSAVFGRAVRAALSKKECFVIPKETMAALAKHDAFESECAGTGKSNSAKELSQ